MHVDKLSQGIEEYFMEQIITHQGDSFRGE